MWKKFNMCYIFSNDALIGKVDTGRILLKNNNFKDKFKICTDTLIFQPCCPCTIDMR